LASQTVVFDLEGTLVHVTVDDSKVVEFVMGELRRLNPGLNFQRAYGAVELLRQVEGKVESSALEETRKSVSSKLAEVEKASAASARERKDARSALLSLQSKGIKAGVITGLSEQGAKEALRHVSLEGTVSIFASRDDSLDQRERMAIAVKKAGSKPDDVIFVADSSSDVEAARSSGVRCFAVYSQEVPVNQILASKPDAFLFTISELEDTMLLFAQKSKAQQAVPAAEGGGEQSSTAPDGAQTVEPGQETTGGR
jgi:phosphoglycolate phosphatase-like HAD superfamily hydrolase